MNELSKSEKMLDEINQINCLSGQIEALLDLMQMTEESIDIRSVKTASEMIMTMHMEIMTHVNSIYEGTK